MLGWYLPSWLCQSEWQGPSVTSLRKESDVSLHQRTHPEINMETKHHHSWSHKILFHFQTIIFGVQPLVFQGVPSLQTSGLCRSFQMSRFFLLFSFFGKRETVTLRKIPWEMARWKHCDGKGTYAENGWKRYHCLKRKGLAIAVCLHLTDF